jgi:hypothetical protein
VKTPYDGTAFGAAKASSDRIAPKLLAVSKKRDARFFISPVEKLYLATAKIIDTVFDSYENKAVYGIERQSQVWRKSVKIIKHDRQTQFEKSLAFVHELCANADPTPIKWPSMGKYSSQKVNGSKFVVANRFESPGIQLVDIVLWLFGRMNSGNTL